MFQKTLGGSVAERPISAQVMISRCEFDPHTGLCVDGAEPAWDSLCLSVSLCLFLCPSTTHGAHALSLSKGVNKLKVPSYPFSTW